LSLTLDQLYAGTNVSTILRPVHDDGNVGTVE